MMSRRRAAEKGDLVADALHALLVVSQGGGGGVDAAAATVQKTMLAPCRRIFVDAARGAGAGLPAQQQGGRTLYEGVGRRCIGVGGRAHVR
jgi:hypothetical protein